MSKANNTTEQGFVSHLLELRDRLIRACGAIFVVFAALCAWPGPGPLFDLIAKPIVAQLPQGGRLISTGVIDPFLVPLQVTLMMGFVIALPVVLYQMWAFIAPGLYTHEKKLAFPLIASSTLLFMLGMAFCYFFVFGRVFHFIQGFAPSSVTAAPDIQSYWSFVLTMFLAFGLAFEVPVVVVMLVRFGFVNLTQLKQARRYVIVAAFVVAAIVTPPDVVSQLCLAIPLCILYEFGVYFARFAVPKADRAKPAQTQQETPAQP